MSQRAAIAGNRNKETYAPDEGAIGSDPADDKEEYAEETKECMIHFIPFSEKLFQ